MVPSHGAGPLAVKVPEPWGDPERRRVALVIGFLLALAIITAVVWVIATYPRDRRQAPPQPPIQPPGAIVVLMPALPGR